MSNALTSVMDESTRRYYLDAMGIQCWQSIDTLPVDEVQLADAIVSNRVSNKVSSEVSSSNEAGLTHAALNDEVQQCDLCSLHETRKQALPGRGNVSAELMFVLLSPTASDDENQALCSGAAHDLFSKMLAAIDINIDDVFITSLLKCQVAENRTISAKEIQSCNKYLTQQVQLVQPALIVILGETTIRCLLQKDVSMDDCREDNKIVMQEAGLQLMSTPLFVSFSPTELLKNPENKRKAWSDLQQLKAILNKT